MQRLSSLGPLLIFTDCFLSVIQLQMMSYLPLVFPVPVSIQESEVLRARGSGLLARKSRGWEVSIPRTQLTPSPCGHMQLQMPKQAVLSPGL